MNHTGEEDKNGPLNNGAMSLAPWQHKQILRELSEYQVSNIASICPECTKIRLNASWNISHMFSTEEAGFISLPKHQISFRFFIFGRAGRVGWWGVNCNSLSFRAFFKFKGESKAISILLQDVNQSKKNKTS